MIVHKDDVISLMMAQMRLKKNTVYEYMRHPEFPLPVRQLGTYKAYNLGAVCDFLAIEEEDAVRIISATKTQLNQPQTA